MEQTEPWKLLPLLAGGVTHRDQGNDNQGFDHVGITVGPVSSVKQGKPQQYSYSYLIVEKVVQWSD